MNKKIIILIILISLFTAGGIFWWWQSEKKEIKETEEKHTVTETTTVKGKAIPPSGIAPESLTIVGLASTAVVDKQGNFSIKAYQNGVTAVAAMPKDKEFGLVKIVVASVEETGDNFTINARTTAAALVFMTPFFLTNEPSRAKEILDVIDHDAKVQALAEVIAAVFSKEDPLNDSSYQQAFKAAIESVAFTINR